jgi:hypothetical protein
MTAAAATTEHDFDVEIGNLRALLRAAMMVELTTIPVYLQAAFSLEDRDDGAANREALEAIRSVLVEEMLHLTLAANILNAVGGDPMLNDPKWVPSYPCPLFPLRALGCHFHEWDETRKAWKRRTITGAYELTVRLRPFSREQVTLFENIEAQHKTREGDLAAYVESIGAFYAIIASQLSWMVQTFGRKAVFCGSGGRQVGPEFYYAAGGTLRAIDPGAEDALEQALAAITLITEEGEGLEHGHEVFDGEALPGQPGMDVAHVFKFREILHGRRYRAGDRAGDPPSGEPMTVDWTAVWPAIDDPGADSHAIPPDVAEAMRAFDRRYSDLLRQINRGYSGEPRLLRDAVHGMFALKYAGIALMRTPLGDGRNAAPAWRFMEAGG